MNTRPYFVEPTHDETAFRAFLIWEQEGRESGRELDYWLQAQAQLHAELQARAVVVAEHATKPWPPPRAERTVSSQPRRAKSRSTMQVPVLDLSRSAKTALPRSARCAA